MDQSPEVTFQNGVGLILIINDEAYQENPFHIAFQSSIVSSPTGQGGIQPYPLINGTLNLKRPTSFDIITTVPGFHSFPIFHIMIII